MALAYVGIGSNLGEPRRQVEAACAALEQLPATRLLKRSALYRSAPIGYPDQPDFINAVAALDTALSPTALLDGLQAIERAQRRTRSFPNAPRTLDLDILLIDELQIDDQRLRIPHPRMAEREFVLRPLLEIAPDVSIPGRGSAAALLERCARQDVQKLA